MKKTRAKRLGKLPPRYKFILNPYTDVRFSKCPKCDRLTYPRKFPLLIHVQEGERGLGIILSKTCKYCPKCEIIIAHQDELDAVLKEQCAITAPQLSGKEYFVLGTVERKFWQQGLTQAFGTPEMLEHLADFKDYLTVHYQPAGWYRDDSK